MMSSDQHARDQTRTYDRRTSVVFCKTQEAFGGLSNMAAGYPLVVNGADIRTSEALYQACRFPHRPDVQRLIIAERSPMTAKMKGKPHRHDTRQDWDAVRVTIMRWCLRVKLAQNWRQFSELLLSTGERPIVEESRKDAFWGAKVVDPGTLVGMNVLGRLLMELREELKSAPADQLQRVEPPRIPEFHLYGQPIGVVARGGVPVRGSDMSRHPLLDTASPSETPAAANAAVSTQPAVTTAAVPELKTTMNDGSDGLIPKECKRLAEVDFPIAVVSKHAAREKSIRHGYPSTFQLWWARRPFGSCRAVLLALLLPDPCDPLCPAKFKIEARKALVGLPSAPARWMQTLSDDAALREALLIVLGQYADWDLSADAGFGKCMLKLIRAAHGVAAPVVVDPFGGGGTIPIEAMRLGCDATGSDLNPVAAWVLRSCLELLPAGGGTVLDDIRVTAEQLKVDVERLLSPAFPVDPDGSRPIAYFWARTATCESPHCGAQIPLVSSFWLSKKASRLMALRYVQSSIYPGTPEIQVEVFVPRDASEVPPATARQARVTCPCCNSVILPKRLQEIMREQRGGGDVQFAADGRRIGGARLMAVALKYPHGGARQYRVPVDADYAAFWRAKELLENLCREQAGSGLSAIPDELVNPIRPSPNARGLSAVTRYGVRTFGDLFNTRQLLTLVTIARSLRTLWEQGDAATRRCCELLLPVIGKRADYGSICTRWHFTFEKATCTFSKQALANTWDFVEATAIGSSSGSLGAGIETVLEACETLHRVSTRPGQALIADATESPLPDDSSDVWFTDPPYYDAIPYADLSDFFFVWMRRAMPTHRFLQQMEPGTALTPKTAECVWNQSYIVDGKAKDGQFFERTVAKAFSEGRRILKQDGIGCVVFAHKTTEGWEALLSGMNRAGWTITASWPILTERPGRLQSQESAALASSVHLVCRPRPEDAPIGDWGDVLRELPRRVAEWMDRLQAEGVRGADLVFACIGPALEIYSRYSKVVDPQEREIPLGGDPEAREPHLRGYLAYVWEVVGRAALNQVLGTAEASARNGAAGALEEDARLTALFLWTLQATATSDDNDNGEDGDAEGEESEDEETDSAGSGRKKKGFSLIYDVARRFAQPLGIHMEAWEKRIIETEKGVVRLLPVLERAEQLFGEDGASAVADRIERSGSAAASQLQLFPQQEEAPRVRGRGRRRADVPDEALRSRREATTLDRVHAAMLLQAGGRANALRALLKAEMERGPDFLRLANALSALYPQGSDEKRLVDAMLLAVPR